MMKLGKVKITSRMPRMISMRFASIAISLAGMLTWLTGMRSPLTWSLCEDVEPFSCCRVIGRRKGIVN